MEAGITKRGSTKGKKGVPRNNVLNNGDFFRFFTFSGSCDQPRRPGRAPPRRIKNLDHTKKHGTAPPGPARGPGPGGPRISDFHNSGVSSETFMPVSKEPVFLFFRDKATCPLTGRTPMLNFTKPCQPPVPQQFSLPLRVFPGHVRAGREVFHAH